MLNHENIFNSKDFFKKNYPELDYKDIKCPECKKQMRISSLRKNTDNHWVLCNMSEPDQLIHEIIIDAECFDCNIELEIKKNKIEYKKDIELI